MLQTQLDLSLRLTMSSRPLYLTQQYRIWLCGNGQSLTFFASSTRLAGNHCVSRNTCDAWSPLPLISVRIVVGDQECLTKSTILILAMTGILGVDSNSLDMVFDMLFYTNLALRWALPGHQRKASMIYLITAIQAAITHGRSIR